MINFLAFFSGCWQAYCTQPFSKSTTLGPGFTHFVEPLLAVYSNLYFDPPLISGLHNEHIMDPPVVTVNSNNTLEDPDTKLSFSLLDFGNAVFQ